MAGDYISIKEAAGLSQKSVQTIRRAVKSKKLKAKKHKTAQGFNYLVNRSSLLALYKDDCGLKLKKKAKKTTNQMTNQATNQMTNQATNQMTSQATNQMTSHATNQTDKAAALIASGDLIEFHKTLQQLIQEHSQERQNYLRLIHALQEKITSLDNRVNLLQTANAKKWFQFWK